MQIIRPHKKRRIEDPFLTIPSDEDWGACALCLSWEKLTEAHIPPQAAGNINEWDGRSYMTTVAAKDQDLYFGRRFRGGFRLKTLCADCNSKLGASEDKALAKFFEGVRKLVETPILLTTRTVNIPAKPNLIFRGMLAHLASANVDGHPCSFDKEARDIFWKNLPLSLTSWNLFYWLYFGTNLVVMRNIFHTTWSPTVEVRPLFLLKIYPLAFLFLQEPWFMGLPNMRTHFVKSDDEETQLPIPVMAYDAHPLWPATTSDRNAIMAGGNTFGFVGSRR